MIYAHTPMWTIEGAKPVEWRNNHFAGLSKPRKKTTPNWDLLLRHVAEIIHKGGTTPVVVEFETIDTPEHNESRDLIDETFYIAEGGHSAIRMSAFIDRVARAGATAAAIGEYIDAIRQRGGTGRVFGCFDQTGGHAWRAWDPAHPSHLDHRAAFRAVSPIGTMYCGPAYLNAARLKWCREHAITGADLAVWIAGRVAIARQCYPTVCLSLHPTTMRKHTGPMSERQAKAAYIGDDYWHAMLEAAIAAGDGAVVWTHTTMPPITAAVTIAEKVAHETQPRPGQKESA